METTPEPPSILSSVQPPPLGPRRIFTTWWPLAASWMLMGAEGPAISAIVSRLAEPTINLAAYGGLVFPLALLVEAPIIMMLAASTALSQDWASYLKLRRFMNRMGAVLTAIHIIIVATPLYTVIARDVIQAPEEIIGPARIGLAILVPWAWAIAHRRFHQGVLIRYGHSLQVGLGTVVRLTADALVLAIGFSIGSIGGVAIAAATLTAGVLAEALYARITVRHTLSRQLRPAPAADRPLTNRALLSFYIPLSLTQLLVLVASPIGSAAMSRMPLALESLAAWPVVGSLSFLFRGFGGAFNEVVVTLIGERRSSPRLRRFALGLGLASTIVMAVLLIPVLSRAVFAGLLDLAEPLPDLVRWSLIILLPVPALAVAQSYFQGIILHSRRTRSITESVGIFLAVVAAILLGGVIWGAVTGLYLAVGALALGEALRTYWLWARSRAARTVIRERDAEEPSLP